MSIITNIIGATVSEPSTSRILANVATNIFLNKMNGNPALSNDNMNDPTTMFVDRTFDMLCKVTKEAFYEVVQEELQYEKEFLASNAKILSDCAAQKRK